MMNEVKKYHCDVCDMNILSSSRSKHLKSKKHILRFREKDDTDKKKIQATKNCTICYDEHETFIYCGKCSQIWCVDCDKSLAECPFCREIIPGREEKLIKQKRENREWQLDQDAFAIQLTNEIIPNTFLVNQSIFQNEMQMHIQNEIMVDLQNIRLRRLVLSLWDENIN